MAHHGALARLHAGVLDGAGGDAVIVDASLVTGAVSVRPAVNLVTSHPRVSRQSWRAAADCLVVGGCTDGLATTRSIAGATHRATLLIAADVSVQTVIVHPTLDLDTGHVRVSFISLLAGADGLVVDHSAEGVISAGAGVFTDLVDAGVRLSALVVSLAAGEDGAEGLTALVVTGHVAVRTRADHGPHRQGVNHGAGGGGHAGAEVLTQQATSVVQTGVLGRTVSVLHTLRGRYGHTLHPGVSSVTDGTSALRLVVAHQALSTGSAGVLVQTGVDTVLAPAGSVKGTLRVTAAADDLTG